MRRLAVLLALLAAGTARAGDGVDPDSLVRQLRALVARHAYAAADSVAVEAMPRLLAPGLPARPRLADAADEVLDVALRFTHESLPLADSLSASALAIRRAGSDSLALARTLFIAAALQTFHNSGVPALRLGGEALRLQLAHAPDDSTMLAEMHEVLGRASLMLEDPHGTAEHYRAALAIQERRPGRDGPDLASLLIGLAGASWSGNQPAESARGYERAVAWMEANGVGDAEAMQVALQGLMQTYSVLGDLPRARRMGERAVAFADSTFGPASSTTAWAHSRFADVLADLDEMDEAHRQAELGVRIWQRSGRGPTLIFASVLKISGEVDYDMHMLDSAAVRIAGAIRVREASAGPDDPWVLHARSRLAEVESERGHPLRALGLTQPLMPRAERLGGRWLLGLADDLARIHRALGHHAVAESLFAFIAAAQDSVAGPRSAITLLARENRAASLYDMGERPRAFELAFDVQARARELLADAASQLADDEALASAAELARGTALLLTLASDRRGLPPALRLAAWDAVARARLAVLAERAEQRRTLRAGDPEVGRRLARLAAARDTLARLAVHALEAGRSDSLLARLDDARRRRDGAERALAEVSLAYRDARPARAAGIEQVLAALPAGAALVSYVRFDFRRTPVAADSGLGAPAEARYVAFVRAAGAGEPQVVPLGDARTIDELVARWNERSAHPVAAADTLAWRRYRALGASLRARVWDPLRGRLGAATRVVVVPDGPLANVNLLALPTGRDGWFVESGPALTVLARELDLVRDDAGGPAGRGLLAVGDPAFGARPADAAGGAIADAGGGSVRSRLRDVDSLSLAALPGSAEEARMLAGLWGGLGDAYGGASTLLGEDASEEAFKAAAPGRRVLHLATHGLSLAGRRVRLEPSARGVGGVTSRADGAPGGARDDLAALAFAGAAHPDTSGTRDDGWLTSEEVLSLDLSGVDWAVLSACETGVGDPRARESVQGLVRAFRLAGARTVIASLWPVDDRATREWMTALYRARWQAGRPTPDAVRQACRETLAARRARGENVHPFYWGAFVAVGSDR